jgi:hypothetical protein
VCRRPPTSAESNGSGTTTGISGVAQATGSCPRRSARRARRDATGRRGVRRDRETRRVRPDERRPDGPPAVIVDFDVRDHLLFVTVANVTDAPAWQVRVSFDPPFSGLGGRLDVGALALFRRLEFLAPWKEISALVDASPAFFARKEPTRIAAKIGYRTADGRTRRHVIEHDLEIYRDLPTPTDAA